MPFARVRLVNVLMAIPALLLLLSGCYSAEIALEQPAEFEPDARFAGDWSFPADGKLKPITVSVRPAVIAGDKRSFDVEYSDGARTIKGVGVIVPVKDVLFVQIRPTTPEGQPRSQERWMARIKLTDGGKLAVQQLNPYFFYPKRLTAPDHLQHLLEHNLDNPEMYQGDWRYGTKKQ